MKNTRLSLKDNTLLVPQPQEVEELVEQVVGSTSMVVAMVEVEEVEGEEADVVVIKVEDEAVEMAVEAESRWPQYTLPFRRRMEQNNTRTANEHSRSTWDKEEYWSCWH